MRPPKQAVFTFPGEGTDDLDGSVGERLMPMRKRAERMERYTGLADWVLIVGIAYDMCTEFGFRPSAGELERLALAALGAAAKPGGSLAKVTCESATDEILRWLPWMQFAHAVHELLERGGAHLAHHVLATPLLWLLAHQDQHAKLSLARSHLGVASRQRIAQMPSFIEACKATVGALRDELQRHEDRRPEPAEAHAVALRVAHLFAARLRAGTAHCSPSVEEQLAQLVRQISQPTSQYPGVRASERERFDSAAFVKSQHAKCLLRAQVAECVAEEALPSRWRPYALEAWGGKLSRNFCAQASEQGLEAGTLRRYVHEMRIYMATDLFFIKVAHIAKRFNLNGAGVIDLLANKPLCRQCATQETGA